MNAPVSRIEELSFLPEAEVQDRIVVAKQMLGDRLVILGTTISAKK